MTVNYKSFMLNLLSVVFLLLFLFNCNNKKIGNTNANLKIQVVDKFINEPIPNVSIKVQEVKKSIWGTYWWEYYNIHESICDSLGISTIAIDSTGTYSLVLTRDSGTSFYCTNQFEAKEINLNDVHIIKCYNKSKIYPDSIKSKFETLYKRVDSKN